MGNASKVPVLLWNTDQQAFGHNENKRKYQGKSHCQAVGFLSTWLIGGLSPGIFAYFHRMLCIRHGGLWPPCPKVT